MTQPSLSPPAAGAEGAPPLSSPTLRPETERYKSEIEYFDREAEEAARALAPIDPLVLERYRSHSRRRFNKEFRLRLLRPLEGKRVLEIGCGDGEQAVLLSTLGAKVTGVDISPKSIALARERARLAGVEGRATFVCAPLATAEIELSGYDAIWGDGILHHVIPELDMVMARIVDWARPGALVVLTEPVNLSPTLRKLRMMVPVPLEGTPDERPLEPAEIATVGRYLERMQVRPFLLTSRVAKFVLSNRSYERSSLPRRALANALQVVDYGLLSLPAMQRFAGQLVIYGTVKK